MRQTKTTNSNKALLLADDQDGFEPLGTCLSELGYAPRPEQVINIDMLDRETLQENELIVLNVRSLNALHHSILLSTQQLSPCPVVVFTKESDEESIMLAVNAGANSIIIDGIECRRVPGILKIAQARFRRCMTLREELYTAQQKLKDRTQVERAKGILMKRKGMDEEQAYRFLRKMAMDKNQRIGELASSLLEFESILE